MEESEKAGSHQESNPELLACAASALLLSYNNRTTTNPRLVSFLHDHCIIKIGLKQKGNVLRVVQP